MEVSVIIPTYKPGEYISDCLESLSRQTLSPELFEIIIILNGCDEPWHSKINRLRKKFLSNFNVILIQTEQGGVSNARNIGIETSKGKFITFIDDDDYVSVAYLEELLNNSSRDCVALTDAVYFDDVSGEEYRQNAHHLNFIKNQKKKQNYFLRIIFGELCILNWHHNHILH